MLTKIKRVMDVVGASAGLLLLGPAMLLVAAVIRLRMGSPVLFAQERPGLGERPFIMYKFRTMLDSTDRQGRPLPDERRLTRLGSWLRAASLDELPELVNVLRGDMSLVGPRPLLTEYLPLYTREQARRHQMKPGITGWAQVNGRNAIDWDQKFAYDLWYIDNWSLMLDLRILWLTVRQVFARKGISAADHATMPKFKGARDSEAASILTETSE